jgi:hypothetical protein
MLIIFPQSEHPYPYSTAIGLSDEMMATTPMYQSIQSVKKSACSLSKNSLPESELSPDSHPKNGSRFSICDHCCPRGVSPDFQFVTIVLSSWRDLLTLKPGKTQTGVPKLAGRQQQSTTMALGMDPGSHVLRSQAACYMVLSQYGIVKKI